MTVLIFCSLLGAHKDLIVTSSVTPQESSRVGKTPPGSEPADLGGPDLLGGQRDISTTGQLPESGS